MDYELLLLLSGLLLGVTLGSSEEIPRVVSKRDSSEDLKLVCYYSNWAVYRPGLSKFTPQNINPYLCTHLIYAFAALSEEYELEQYDPYNDMEQGNYKSFVGLKTYNSKLKTMLAVGGWNEGSKRFSRMVEFPENRQKFVRSALRFLRENEFDGLDLDWEYPTYREGGNDTDKKGYAQLIRELRTAIDEEQIPQGKYRLLLSVAVPATKEYIDRGFDVPVIAKNVDFLNLLTYDYHTAYELETNHHAPLFPYPDASELDPRQKLNVEWTVDYYIQLGAPSNKIVVGIPTYGRSYQLADSKFTGLEAAAIGPGEEGVATREKGYLAFYEICQRVKDDEWEVEAPYPQLMGPYAYSNDQWVGFDDEEMVALKARFIIERELGGAMVWTLDNDDFRGLCTGEQNPLVNSLRGALLSNVIEGSSSQRSVARFVGPESASIGTARVVFDDEASTVDEVATPPRRRTTLRKLVQNRQSARRVNTDNKSNIITTPTPPTTPDPGVAFECRKEGFFNNPRDCKKYFWCLDSGPANLGIVAHAFTCPSGLYFNSATESCDYTENVVCLTRSANERQTSKPPSSRLARPRGRTTTTTTTATTTTTTTQASPITFDYDIEGESDDFDDVAKQVSSKNESSEGKNVAELIRLLQAIGGVEKLQSLLGSQVSKSYDPKPTVESSIETSNRDIPSVVEDVRSPVDSYAINDTSPYQTIPSSGNHYDLENPYKPFTVLSMSEATFTLDEPTLVNQVPRRPQFEAPEQDIFQYIQPERITTSKTEENGVNSDYGNPSFVSDDRNVEDFPFEYHTPSRIYDDLPGKTLNPLNQRDGDGPTGEIRSTLPLEVAEEKSTTPPSLPATITIPKAPVSVSTVTENTTGQKEAKLPGEAYRAPIRVQVGRVVRVQNAVDGNNFVRRRMRVRVRPAAPNTRVSEPERVSRVVGRIPEGRRIAVADLPQRPMFHGNGGDRVAVRRRPLNQNDFENSSLPTVRLVARSRRPQEARNTPRKVQPSVNYVSEQIADHSDRVASTTEYSTVSATDASQHPQPSAEYGYQPPIHQPVSSKPVHEEVDENIDDYDEDYEDIPISEIEDYESSNTQPNIPKEPSKTTTTTTEVPITTVSLHQRPTVTRQKVTGSRSRTTSVQTTPRVTTVRRTSSTPPTTTKRPQQKTTTLTPRTALPDEDLEDTVVVRSDNDVDCFRRGVFIHPDDCSKFVVCAPASRLEHDLRGRVLHCPANQIYLEDIGRCMKGDRNNCVKLKTKFDRN